MFFERIYEEGLAQASYLIACQATGEAIVIDPRRDIDVYLDIAKKKSFKITHVSETHIHADFLSGVRELAYATGAEILLSDEGGRDWQYEFPHVGLKAGESFMVGNLKFEVMHVPGHTPEHIAFLLTDIPAGDYPSMLFTGDFVFVGSVGRPDLLEKAAGIKGTQELGARQMFDSLKQFSNLPDYIQVWPGHGAGSACGKALGAVPNSTIGYEKLANWALTTEDEGNFVETLLDGQPEPPRYFAMMKKLNKQGPSVLNGMPKPPQLDVAAFMEAYESGMTLVDTRRKGPFSEGHIPGSICIPGVGSFSNWAGWLLEYDKPFMVLASEAEIETIVRKLIRIGLDNLHGYITGLDVWTGAGRELATLPQIDAEAAQRMVEKGEAHILDVRAKSEYIDGHIPGVTNIHLGYVRESIDEIPQDKTLIVQCLSGARSTIGSSVLMNKGIADVLNLDGGIQAWRKAGLPTEK